jgi:hypothetical protein
MRHTAVMGEARIVRIVALKLLYSFYMLSFLQKNQKLMVVLRVALVVGVTASMLLMILAPIFS